MTCSIHRSGLNLRLYHDVSAVICKLSLLAFFSYSIKKGDWNQFQLKQAPRASTSALIESSFFCLIYLIFFTPQACR